MSPEALTPSRIASPVSTSTSPLGVPLPPVIDRLNASASASATSSSSLSLNPSLPKLELNKAAKLTGPAVSLGVSVSSVTRVGTATVLRLMVGPSSSNWNAAPMLAVALAVSPSPSVMVAVEDDQARGHGRRRSAGLDRVGRIVVGDRAVLLEADRAGRRIKIDGERDRRRSARQHSPRCRPKR